MKYLLALLALTITVHAGWNDWTPQQQSDFRALVATAPMEGTAQIRDWCNERDISSYTYTTNWTAREAYSLETAMRDVLVPEYMANLSGLGGLTPQERFEFLQTLFKDARDAAATEAAKGVVRDDTLELKSLNDMAKEYDGGLSATSVLQPSNSTVTVTVNLAPSRAQAIGISEVITPSDVEAAQ